MKAIKKEHWIPTDDLKLEDNAMIIAKSDFNSLVVAGPGAGKTELLAQRAAYLLQTNECKYPKKILAISFKKDAAFNLKERVNKRCGDSLANRFDSLTFDAFAKQILDRFKTALPQAYKISDSYKIILAEQNVIVDTYRALSLDIANRNQERAIVDFHYQFPFNDVATNDQERFRTIAWQTLLKSSPSRLTFKSVMLLAELIIETNTKIKRYLQQTYQYVFLDEFQDTTTIQYNFFKTCFGNCNCIITAVGDDKQMIMGWAGARRRIFEEFMHDTGAKHTPLKMNFRSAPRLVELQNYLAENLLSKSETATPSSGWEDEDGEALVIFYNNPTEETEDLYAQVHEWINKDKINPRDICILVKQRLQTYASELIDYFNANNIKARDESVIHDVINNDIGRFIVNAMQVAFSKNASEQKLFCIRLLSNIRTEAIDVQLLKLETEFAALIKSVKLAYSGKLSQPQINSLIDNLVDFVGKARICSFYPLFRDQQDLDEMLDNFKEWLWNYYSASFNILEAIDALLGKDTIPVMTVHKSKGMEYHSIIFVGLENGAFWSFATQEEEDKNSFFVALSRAKERVIFTFSRLRPGRNGLELQGFGNIQVLFDNLEQSGVVEIIDNITQV